MKNTLVVCFTALLIAGAATYVGLANAGVDLARVRVEQERVELDRSRLTVESLQALGRFQLDMAKHNKQLLLDGPTVETSPDQSVVRPTPSPHPTPVARRL